MRVGIVGGALQGMEATYLSKKAGYETLVLDRRKEAPALSMADAIEIMDVERDFSAAIRVLSDCDAILPANENIGALRAVKYISERTGVPLLFDMDAYEVSESKIKSNLLLERLGVSMPRKWPSCGFPAVVKPSVGSGSTGVAKVNCQQEMEVHVRRIRENGSEPVIEQYVNGHNISIEVIGNGTEFVPYVLTEVVLDDMYDCKRVYSPYRCDDGMAKDFANQAVKTARALGLKGIMDMEAIVVEGTPMVLEIDARIPSQTPAAIFHSHGINLIEELVDAVTGRKPRPPREKTGRASVYEHIAVENGIMRSCGEGEFAKVCRPKVLHGYFGADEVITDHKPGASTWVATIMISAKDHSSLIRRRMDCLRGIMEENRISRYIDPFPEGYDDSVDH